jgi:hypothetical protein
MALTSRESSSKAIFLVLILAIIVLAIAFFLGGTQGIFGVIRFFIMAGLIIGFFGFIFYIVYFLFFMKHRQDIPYMNWKDYLKSALDNGSDMMQELILMGDKKHSSKSFLTIKGYLRIMSFDGLEYDMFVGKKNPLNFLEEYKIVLLRPNQHTDLIGDVYVSGISLIKKYGYYFVNSELLDFEGVDKTVAYDTYRTIMYHMLGDMKGILDRATGLDSEHAKQLSQQKLLKIPVLTGQQSPPQQPQQ